MAITKIPAAGFSDAVNFRNIIINGDMSIAQRGTSETGITGSSFVVDRFKFLPTSMGTWTQSQSTTVPSGQGFANSIKLDCTTADASPAAGDHIRLLYNMEGQHLQYLKKGTSSAESLTLSFWVRSNKTGTYICEIYDHENARQISKSYTISSADTWEKKTLSFAGDTSGTLSNDNSLRMTCTFFLGAGSNFTSGTLNTSWNSATTANRAVGQVNLADSTSNEWYVTGVQLEAGTAASEFEFLPVDVNKRRCLRYTQVLPPSNFSGQFYAATHARFYNQLKPEMRSSPSFSFSGSLTNAVEEVGVATRTPTNVTLNNSNERSFGLTAEGMSSGTSQNMAHLGSITITFNSEL